MTLFILAAIAGLFLVAVVPMLVTVLTIWAVDSLSQPQKRLK